MLNPIRLMVGMDRTGLEMRQYAARPYLEHRSPKQAKPVQVKLVGHVNGSFQGVIRNHMLHSIFKQESH
jgi:hypothetical protein